MCLKELKKKEMEELDAVFAEFGIEAKTDNQADGKKKKRKDKKKDQQSEDGNQPAGQSSASQVEAKQEAAEAEEPENDEDGQSLDPAVVSQWGGAL